MDPWVKDVPVKDLYNWESKFKNYDIKKLDYFKPIVEYKKAREESVKMYRKACNHIYMNKLLILEKEYNEYKANNKIIDLYNTDLKILNILKMLLKDLFWLDVKFMTHLMDFTLLIKLKKCHY